MSTFTCSNTEPLVSLSVCYILLKNEATTAGTYSRHRQ